VTLADLLLLIGSGTGKYSYVVAPEIFVPNSGTTRAPSFPPPKEEDIGSQMDCPDPKGQASSS
jgi:hypothetical protein